LPPAESTPALAGPPLQAPGQQTGEFVQTGAALPAQAFQLPGVVTAAQPQSAAAQAAPLPAQSFSQANGQPAQPVQVPAGQRPAGGNLAAESGADVQTKDVVQDAGRESVLAAVKQLTANDGERISTGREQLAGVVRQAIQSLPAGQAGGGELGQSMQEQRDMPFAGTALPAMTRSEANALAFMQNLSESSPLALPSARVQVPVGQQGWAREVGQQLMMFVSQDVSAAKLHLNPRHLGPMEMQINLDGDKANVSILSQHSVVREALESSLPRLREMLAESGLNLGNVNISQHGSSGQNGRGMDGARQGMDFPGAGAGGIEMDAVEDMPHTPVVAVGLIDDYA